MGHKHEWALARFDSASLTHVGEKTMQMIPARAFWVCICGQSKYVDIVAETKPPKTKPKRGW